MFYLQRTKCPPSCYSAIRQAPVLGRLELLGRMALMIFVRGCSESEGSELD